MKILVKCIFVYDNHWEQTKQYIYIYKYEKRLKVLMLEKKQLKLAK